VPHGGNVNIMTVMGDARMDGLSDAGSTPARSTIILSNTENVPWAGFLIYLRTQRKVIVSEESVN
jgi:hypothetical protein